MAYDRFPYEIECIPGIVASYRKAKADQNNGGLSDKQLQEIARTFGNDAVDYAVKRNRTIADPEKRRRAQINSLCEFLEGQQVT